MTTSRKWLIGGILGALVLLALGWVLLISPARDRAAEVDLQAESTNADNVRLAAKVETLKQQSAEVPAKLAQIEAVKKKMPAEIRQPAIVRAVERLANFAGVDLTGIAPETPTTLEGSDVGTIVLPVSVTAKGSYTAVKTFVDLMQRQERAFLIRTVNVARGETDGEDFELTMEGDYFALPVGALDTPAAKADPGQPEAAAAAKMPRKKNR